MTLAEESKHKLDSARQFAIDAARLAATTRCHNVAVLDVGAISPVTDFLVIATGTSPRQMNTVCKEIEELGGPRDFKTFRRSDDDSSNWSVMDFVDVVVHVFSQDSRLFYDLDGLWGDAKKIEWREDAPVETVMH